MRHDPPDRIEAFDVLDGFGRFTDQWSPKIVADLNGQQIKLARVQGEFVWHDHADEDELFLVYRGTLHLRFRDGREVSVGPGQLFVVPRGVEHLPYTDPEEEVWLMLMEPASTRHTGAVESDRTVHDQERLADG